MSFAAKNIDALEASVLKAVSQLEGSVPDSRDGLAHAALAALEALITEAGYEHYKLAPEFVKAVKPLVQWALKDARLEALRSLQTWGLITAEDKNNVDLVCFLGEKKFTEFKELLETVALESTPETLVFTIDVLEEMARHLCACYNAQNTDVTSEKLQEIVSALNNIRYLAARREGATRVQGSIQERADAHPISKEENRRLYERVSNALASIMHASIVSPVYPNPAVLRVISSLFEKNVDLNNPAADAQPRLIETAIEMSVDNFFALTNAAYGAVDLPSYKVDKMLCASANYFLTNGKISQAILVVCAIKDGISDEDIDGPYEDDHQNLLQRSVSLQGVASSTQYRLVKSLVAKGADLSCLDMESAQKLLILVLQNEAAQLDSSLQAMREKHIDMDALFAVKDNKNASVSLLSGGCTLLHLAAQEPQEDAVSVILRQMGPKTSKFVNLKNNGNWTPLHYAADSGNIGAVRALIEVDADINIVTTNGFQALHFAVRSEASSYRLVVAALCDKAKSLGCNVDGKTSEGLTAAHYAAQSKTDNIDVFTALIQAGANFMVEDDKERIPFDYLMDQYVALMNSTGLLDVPSVDLVLQKLELVLTHFPNVANKKRIVLADYGLPVHALLLHSDRLAALTWNNARRLILGCLDKTQTVALPQSPAIVNGCLYKAVKKRDLDLLNDLLSKGMTLRTTQDAFAHIWQHTLFAAIDSGNPAMLDRLLCFNSDNESAEEYTTRRSQMLCVQNESVAGKYLLHTAILHRSYGLALVLLRYYKQNADDLMFILNAEWEGMNALERLADVEELGADANGARLRSHLVQAEELLRPKTSIGTRLQALVSGFFIGVTWLVSCIFSSTEEESFRSKVEAVWEKYVTHVWKPLCIRPDVDTLATIFPEEVVVPLHFDTGPAPTAGTLENDLGTGVAASQDLDVGARESRLAASKMG